MQFTPRRIAFPVLMAVLALTACEPADRSPEQDSDSEARLVQLDGSGRFHVQTERYRIDLRLPLTANHIAAAAMLDYAEELAQGLIATTLDEPEPGYFATHTYRLTTDWETAVSDHVYTFILRGITDTGGAHPLPLLRTFSYARSDHRPLTVSDLLTSSEALERLSGLAVDHFRAALPNSFDPSGLEPDLENWDLWFTSSRTITFLFPPYQVGTYADGEQRWTVPVDDHVGELLDPAYFVLPEEPTPEAAETAAPGWALEAARRWVENGDAYVEDGYGLRVGALGRRAAQPDTYLITYAWRHFGDPASLYTGTLRVTADSVVDVTNGIGIKGPQDILVDVIGRAAVTDGSEDGRGLGALEIGPHTRVSDALETEHQWMEAYGLLQAAYDLPPERMDKLWAELTALNTVAQWTMQLMESSQLTPD